MGKLIKLGDYMYKWKQIASFDGSNSTLQIYMNTSSGEIEIVQMNDEGEAIRTCLSTVDSVSLSKLISTAHDKLGAR